MASSSSVIFARPENDYQRVVNAYKLKYQYMSSKDMVKNTNIIWKQIKDDPSKVREYQNVAPKPTPPAKKQTTLKFTTISR